MKKYKLDKNDYIIVKYNDGNINREVKLYATIAMRDFILEDLDDKVSVNVGDKGPYVEGEYCLNQNDKAWGNCKTKIYNGASISGNSYIKDTDINNSYVENSFIERSKLNNAFIQDSIVNDSDVHGKFERTVINNSVVNFSNIYADVKIKNVNVLESEIMNTVMDGGVEEFMDIENSTVSGGKFDGYVSIKDSNMVLTKQSRVNEANILRCDITGDINVFYANISDKKFKGENYIRSQDYYIMEK